MFGLEQRSVLHGLKHRKKTITIPHQYRVIEDAVAAKNWIRKKYKYVGTFIVRRYKESNWINDNIPLEWFQGIVINEITSRPIPGYWITLSFTSHPIIKYPN